MTTRGSLSRTCEGNVLPFGTCTHEVPRTHVRPFAVRARFAAAAVTVFAPPKPAGATAERETGEKPPATAMTRTQVRREMRAAMRKEAAADIVGDIPPVGTSLHIVSNGTFDLWTLGTHLLGMMGPATLYASTWLCSRDMALEMLALYDAERVTAITFLSGERLRNLRDGVYSVLTSGLEQRGQRYKALPNHSKVLLLDDGATPITIESSAGLSVNPRVEQHTITHDRDLHAFHRQWMDGLFA
jgi:hypothetical protein